MAKDLKAVKAIFIARGGFQTAKGHLMIVDKEACVQHMFNDKEDLVKTYQIGNGGTNWLESQSVEDFEKSNPALKSK